MYNTQLKPTIGLNTYAAIKAVYGKEPFVAEKKHLPHHLLLKMRATFSTAFIITTFGLSPKSFYRILAEPSVGDTFKCEQLKLLIELLFDSTSYGEFKSQCLELGVYVRGFN